MNLKDFLLRKTQAEELCVICDPWVRATVYIDHEDLFLRYFSCELLEMCVKSDDWEWLYVRSQDGINHRFLAHYIYVEEDKNG